MEKIKKYRDDMKDCATSFKIYFTKLEYSGFFGVEPLLADKVQKNISGILEDTDFSSISEKLEDDIKYPFKMQYLVSSMYRNLSDAYQIFANNRVHIDKQGTRTSSGAALTYSYLQELNETFDKITDIFLSIGDTDLVPKFLAKRIKVENIDKLAECKKIYESYLENGTGQYVVFLYIIVLQNTINEFTGLPEGREIIKQIVKDTEELKTITLVQGAPGVVSEFNRSSNAVQRLVQKFNLVPDDVEKPLAQLLQDISGSSTSIEETSRIISSSGDKKFGFIVIHKIIDRPVKYNIWNLIDENYIESRGLMEEKTVGVNSKSLTRGETIVMQDLVKNPKSTVKFIDDLFDKNNDKNYYYVIETLDGENYYFLLPWSTTIKYIPASWLLPLKNIKKTPSRRVESYNGLLNIEIMKHLKTPFVEFSQFSRDDIIREDSHWRGLRNNIKNIVIGHIRDIVGGWDFVSLDKLNKLINGKDIYKHIVSVIIRQISIENSETDEQIDSELYISYFRDIDKIPKGRRVIQERLRREID
jgi:hypothetical protein